MRKKLELGKGLILQLPGDNEIFGTDNLKIFGSYIGRSVGKVKRYLADDRVNIVEGIGMFGILRKGRDTKKRIDLDQLKREYDDLSHAEWKDIAGTVAIEYYKGLEEDMKEATILELAQSLMDDFFRSEKVLTSLLRDRV